MSKIKFKNTIGEDDRKKVIIRNSVIAMILIVVIGVVTYKIVTNSNIVLPIEVSKSIVKDTDVVPEEVLIKVMVAREDLGSGEEITTLSYSEVEMPMEDIPLSYVDSTEELKGKLSRDIISKGDIIVREDIMDKLSYGENDRYVEHSFAEGELPVTIGNSELVGRYVDINLFLSGAEDKIVLTKKQVIKREGNRLAFYLDFTEMEILKEASTEGRIYIALYNDEGQKPSIKTYEKTY